MDDLKFGSTTGRFQSLTSNQANKPAYIKTSSKRTFLNRTVMPPVLTGDEAASLLELIAATNALGRHLIPANSTYTAKLTAIVDWHRTEQQPRRATGGTRVSDLRYVNVIVSNAGLKRHNYNRIKATEEALTRRLGFEARILQQKNSDPSEFWITSKNKFAPLRANPKLSEFLLNGPNNQMRFKLPLKVSELEELNRKQPK